MKRNCSEETFFTKRTAEYKGYLVNQGYPSKLVDDQFSKASPISRNYLLKTRLKETKKLFPFVTTFNPTLPDVGSIIKKHWSILQSNPKLKELFPRNSIIPSFRRSKNLKELLAPSRFRSTEVGQPIDQTNGSFKCNRSRCDLWHKNTINSRLSCDQWKNTSSVLQWFKHLSNKHRCAFIIFDVVEFYPSIPETLLERALDFAANYVTISDDDRHIILQAKQSLLFNNGNPWQKRNTDTLFDVTMGSYDGAETCELVGTYILSQLKEIPYGMEIGLYRDDGLAALDQTPPKIEKIKKEICKVFAKNNLRITIEANKKVVNFLDVTLDLITEKYKPYSKPTTSPLYVHSKSNHPPCIIKNIPEAINKRLSAISSDEEAFNEAAPPYQEALQKSGYSYTLKFTPPQQQSTESATNKRKRPRNIIWFNPPFSENVQTNIGREFLSLIENCFPPNHKLRKLFNKNNLKLSYSCSPNIKQIIDGHNKTILRQNTPLEEKTPPKHCNCREPNKCPLNGQCLAKEVVYQATITTTESTETYVGLTPTEFKTRWRDQQMSFKHESKKNDTELSKHLWQLKDQKKDFTISWKILAKAKSYTNLTKRCNLCNTEKFYIIYKPDTATLSKRNELVSTCRHKRKFLLKFNRILKNQS